MDYFKCSRETTAIRKMDGFNLYRQITDFFQYRHAWNQVGIIISNYDISLLQFLFCQNTVNLKECVSSICSFILLFIE